MITVAPCSKNIIVKKIAKSVVALMINKQTSRKKNCKIFRSHKSNPLKRYRAKRNKSLTIVLTVV